MTLARFIFGSSFFQLLLFVAGVTLFLLYGPKGCYLETEGTRRAELIGAATENMMPSDIGHALGRAAGYAFMCKEGSDQDSVEVALSHIGLRPHVIEEGGILRHIYSEGYLSAIRFDVDTEWLCALGVQEFGATGTIIPMLLR